MPTEPFVTGKGIGKTVGLAHWLLAVEADQVTLLAYPSLRDVPLVILSDRGGATLTLRDHPSGTADLVVDPKGCLIGEVRSGGAPVEGAEVIVEMRSGERRWTRSRAEGAFTAFVGEGGEGAIEAVIVEGPGGRTRRLDAPDRGRPLVIDLAE